MRFPRPWITMIWFLVGGQAGQAAPLHVRLGKPDFEAPHLALVNQVIYSPTGKLIAVACSDGQVRVWNAVSEFLVAELAGDPGPIFQVSFSPDGGKLAVISGHGVPRIYRLSDKQLLWSLAEYPVLQVTSLTFSPDSQSVALGHVNRTIDLRRADDGQPISTWLVEQQPSALTFCGEGRRLAWASQQGTIGILGLEDQASRSSWTGHEERIYCLSFHGNDKLLSSASSDGTICLWRVDTRSAIRRFDGVVADLSADQRLLVTLTTGSAQSGARFWEPLTGQERRQITDLPIRTVALGLSPDGRTLAAAYGRNLGIWNLEDRILGQYRSPSSLVSTEPGATWVDWREPATWPFGRCALPGIPCRCWRSGCSPPRPQSTRSKPAG